MATALSDPIIESEDLSEDQLLLGEEDKTGHASIIKNSNYKEMTTIKHKEEKGEKQKEKKVGERESDGNNEDRIEEEEQRNDAHHDSGTDGRVNASLLSQLNSELRENKQDYQDNQAPPDSGVVNKNNIHCMLTDLDGNSLI